jgi:thioredoxin 1
MIEIKSKAQLDEAIASNDKVVVDFYAPWCGPCKMLTPLLETMSKENNDVAFFKVNVDENAELSAEYGIQSIPHVFLMKGGKTMEQFKGIQPKPKINEMINNLR